MEYGYIAYSINGKKVVGKKEADSVEDLKEKLKKERLILQSVKGNPNSSIFLFKKKIKQEKIIFFTEEIKIMMESGIGIVNALEIQAEQENDIILKKIINSIKEEILKGKTIWEAFSMYREHFGDNYIEFIRIGELTGTLSENLQRCVEYMILQNELTRKVKEAMFYPMIILIFSLTVVTFLVVYVLPNFTEMFIQSGTKLPFITRMLLFISDNFLKGMGIIIIMLVSGYILLKKYLSNVDNKCTFDRKMLSLPVFGSIIKKNHIVKVSKNFSMMMNSGISLIDILDNISKNVKNQFIQRRSQQMKKSILEGNNISTSIDLLEIYPKNYIKMIAIGEETGRLTEIFDKLSELARKDMEKTIKKMMISMEPLLILILGIIIGIVIVAIYLPIFSMSETLG